MALHQIPVIRVGDVQGAEVLGGVNIGAILASSCHLLREEDHNTFIEIFPILHNVLNAVPLSEAKEHVVEYFGRESSDLSPRLERNTILTRGTVTRDSDSPAEGLQRYKTDRGTCAYIGGVISYSRRCLSVCVSVATKVAVGLSK